MLTVFALGGAILVALFNFGIPRNSAIHSETKNGLGSINSGPFIVESPVVSVIPSQPPTAANVDDIPDLPKVKARLLAHQRNGPLTGPTISNVTPDRSRVGAPPDSKPSAVTPKPESWSEADVAIALRDCLHAHATSDIDFKTQPAVRIGRCGTPAPVLLKAIGRESVVLQPPAVANCALVAALGTWIDHLLQPAARDGFAAPVVRFSDVSAYACRNRNKAADGPISEHAFANAIDIGSFVLADGRVVKVADGRGTVMRDSKQATQNGRSAGIVVPVSKSRALPSSDTGEHLGSQDVTRPSAIDANSSERESPKAFSCTAFMMELVRFFRPCSVQTPMMITEIIFILI